MDTDETCAAIKDIFEDTRSITEPSGALAVHIRTLIYVYEFDIYVRIHIRTLICIYESTHFDIYVRIRQVAGAKKYLADNNLKGENVVPPHSSSFSSLLSSLELSDTKVYEP